MQTAAQAARAQGGAFVCANADALPFAGELLQIRDDERDWEGAIERLLHNFGLSLLVPDEHYATVFSNDQLVRHLRLDHTRKYQPLGQRRRAN